MIPHGSPHIQRSIHVADKVFSFIPGRGKNIIGPFFIFFQLVQANQATAEDSDGNEVTEFFDVRF